MASGCFCGLELGLGFGNQLCVESQPQGRASGERGQSGWGALRKHVCPGPSLEPRVPRVQALLYEWVSKWGQKGEPGEIPRSEAGDGCDHTCGRAVN